MALKLADNLIAREKDNKLFEKRSERYDQFIG